MTILEIEYYKGDVLLYGKTVSELELRRQLSEIEKTYNRKDDNFIELLCRRYDWTRFESDSKPDFTYDRDTEKLLM